MKRSTPAKKAARKTASKSAGTGKTPLRIDFNAILGIYEKTGKDLARGFTKEDLTPSNLAVFYWAGQLHARPDLTLEASKKEMAGMNYLDCLREFTQAYADAFNVNDSEDASA